MWLILTKRLKKKRDFIIPLPPPSACPMMARSQKPVMSRSRALRLLFVLLLVAAGHLSAWAQAPAAEAPIPPASSPPPAAPAPNSIAGLLAGSGDLVLAGRKLDRAQLTAIYQKNDFRPLWNDQRRAELVASLAEAPSHGLDPGAFALPAADPARADILQTDAFLRYANALARGRVSPADFETDWAMPQPAFDGAASLARALADGVPAALATLAPNDADYAHLRQAYARYKSYAGTQAWRPMNLALPLKPGDTGADVALLRHRLLAENYIDPGNPDYDTLYDDDLQAAVTRFQQSHGLPPDGAVGRATLTALNATPGERMREIRLNLERRRSTPREAPATRVEVNIPDASVVFYQDGQEPLVMRAVVGVPDRPTPVLKTRMTAVTLNPPWNVPSSIIVSEIRPALKKDPHYLERNDYAYIDVPGGKQLIQLPGPKNALGKIKFEMPNQLDIYLHDTPSGGLFARVRRAWSHGCVRLGNPRELARRVLAAANWTMETIDAGIAAGKTQTIALPRAIPVYMFYWTAFVGPDSTVEFRDDLYGRDRRLNQALVKRDLSEQLAPAARMASAPGKS